MRFTSFLALGALALSVTAQDGRVVYARQNESSPESSVEYSVAPEPASSSAPSLKPEVDSSPLPASKPTAEPVSSIVAQTEPTPTDAEKKSPTYDTNTDDCKHWGSKCPWGKTVTVTEKKTETVVEKKTETVTVTAKQTDVHTDVQTNVVTKTVTEKEPVVST